MPKGRPTRPSAYKSYLLGVLVAIFACNYADRYALGLVLPDIGRDLQVSDVQLGLLSGIAFALFYSVMGLPIARWADRGNRITIITLTTAAWSVLVATCGIATSFMQLMLIRVGVGVGEAGCMPPAHSLIADYFTRAERPRAISIYLQGPGISLLLGFLLAGWLNEHYGWRVMFIALSVPGLAAAVLARLTLREPRVDGSSGDAVGDRSEGVSPTMSSATPLGLKEACLVLWANRTFRYLLLSYSVLTFFNYGITNWQPAFFVRSFELKTTELGVWLAIVYGISTVIGSYLGGAWASRYAPHNESLQLKVMAVGNVVFSGALWAPIYFMHNKYAAFALMGIANLGGTAVYGPIFAAFQTLVPPSLRAMSIAFVCLCANLIGMGLGPLAVGALSDALRPTLGEESLRYALLALCPGYVWGSWYLWRASQTVAHDLALVSGDYEDVVAGAARVGDTPGPMAAIRHGPL